MVSLHAPAQPDAAALIGAPELALLPAGAVLVNTARASLVDQHAVLAALDSGRLDRYAPDDFDTEAHRSALRRHDQVVLTPHIGALTVEGVGRVTEAAVASLLRVLADPPHI